MNALLNVVERTASCRPTGCRRAFDAKAYDEETSRNHALEHCNRKFAALKADQRVAWALENLPGNHVLTSSFGAQAAVSLHLISRSIRRFPSCFVDTGYFFPETYRFIDDLAARLKINLKVYRAERRRRGKRLVTASAGIKGSRASRLTTKRTRWSRCAARCGTSA